MTEQEWMAACDLARRTGESIDVMIPGVLQGPIPLACLDWHPGTLTYWYTRQKFVVRVKATGEEVVVTDDPQTLVAVFAI